jgi:hypothetical protein
MGVDRIGKRMNEECAMVDTISGVAISTKQQPASPIAQRYDGTQGQRKPLSLGLKPEMDLTLAPQRVAPQL